MPNGPVGTTDERPRIYHARKAAGLTQSAYARLHRIHPITLSRLEQYGRVVPGKALAKKIAKALPGEVSPGEIIDDYERRAS